MNKRDVAPPGREAQVRALKKAPDVDNPYAVAWASKNKSAGDESGMETEMECDDEGEGPILAPGVETPRSTGHTGSAYTYGEKRGSEAVEPAHLAHARAGGPYELADEEEEPKGSKPSSLKEALGDEAESVLGMLSEEGESETISELADSDHVAGSDATRGHPKYGSSRVQDESDADAYDDFGA